MKNTLNAKELTLIDRTPQILQVLKAICKLQLSQ